MGVGTGVGEQRGLGEPRAGDLSKAQNLHPKTIVGSGVFLRGMERVQGDPTNRGPEEGPKLRPHNLGPRPPKAWMWRRPKDDRHPRRRRAAPQSGAQMQGSPPGTAHLEHQPWNTQFSRGGPVAARGRWAGGGQK